MADSNLPHIFDADGAKRIVSAVRRVEGSRLPPAREAQAGNPQITQPPFLGKTAVAIAKGASGTVNVYYGATKGSETWDGSTTVQAYNRFASVASGKWVIVSWVLAGWELTDAEC